MFFQIRYFLPINVSKSLYHAMFFPFLQYGITVWGLTYPTYLQPLFILLLLKRILKAMTYSSMSDHSNPLFRDLELLKLSDIHSPQLLLFVYDCVNHMTPDYFSHYFKHVSDVHSICTRQAIRDDLFLERRHTVQYGIRFVQYSGPKLWNSVPVELRCLKSASQFRAKLKIYFLSQYDKLNN